MGFGESLYKNKANKGEIDALEQGHVAKDAASEVPVAPNNEIGAVANTAPVETLPVKRNIKEEELEKMRKILGVMRQLDPKGTEPINYDKPPTA